MNAVTKRTKYQPTHRGQAGYGNTVLGIMEESMWMSVETIPKGSRAIVERYSSKRCAPECNGLQGEEIVRVDTIIVD